MNWLLLYGTALQFNRLSFPKVSYCHVECFEKLLDWGTSFDIANDQWISFKDMYLLISGLFVPPLYLYAHFRNTKLQFTVKMYGLYKVYKQCNSDEGRYFSFELWSDQSAYKSVIAKTYEKLILYIEYRWILKVFQ